MYIAWSMDASIYMSRTVEIVRMKRGGWIVEVKALMCSACSGDDPRPESFTQFTFPSPNEDATFALRGAIWRRVYGTLRKKRYPTKPASILRNMRISESRAGAWEVAVAERGGAGRTGSPVEILVSTDAIVEVYGFSSGYSDNLSCGLKKCLNVSEVDPGKEWVESRAARKESGRAFSHYRRVRRARAAGAYLVFAALTAFAIWCAVR